MIKAKSKSKREKAFCPFRTNGMHFNFNEEFGLSFIWGAGSYSENHDKGITDKSEKNLIRGNGYYSEKFEKTDLQFHDFYKMVMESDNIELYALGNWPRKLEKKVFKHFKWTDEDGWPIGYVDMDGFLWLMKTIYDYLNNERTKTNTTTH